MAATPNDDTPQVTGHAPATVPGPVPARVAPPNLATVYAAEQAVGTEEACGRVCPWDPGLICARPAGHGEHGVAFRDVHLHDDGTAAGLVQWHENDPYVPASPDPASEPADDPAAPPPSSVLDALAAELGWEDPGALRAALTELRDRAEDPW